MESFDAFLHMGGYGAFVWSAYAVTAFGLIGALVLTWRGLKAREQEFDALKRDRQ